MGKSSRTNNMRNFLSIHERYSTPRAESDLLNPLARVYDVESAESLPEAFYKLLQLFESHMHLK